MGLVPISPTLQKLYRDTLLIPDAPSMIDTKAPVVPVAVLSLPATSTSNPAYVKLPVGATLFQKSFTHTLVANVEETAYTVTPGKMLYITGIFWSSNADSDMRMGDDTTAPTEGNPVDNQIIFISDPTRMMRSFRFVTPFIVTTALKLLCTANNTCWFTVIGWEL